jgi:hypothetical protein
MPKTGLVSASQCGVLLTNGKIPENAPFGVGAITYARKLASERIGVTPEEEYTSYHMERGIELEWEALETYKERTLTEITQSQVWATHPKFDYFGGTPDGLVGQFGGVDVKCPNNSNHLNNILDGADVSKYYDQFQAYMFIFGRQWWDLASCNPNYPEPLNLHIVRVNVDLEWQKKMTERLPIFWDRVVSTEAKLRELLHELP